MNDAFDVIVIGGGHAGAEAAWAAAGLGARTAMVTFDANAIGRLSCNPAIGGIGKGQMAREIDALGGLMGRVADEAGIQFRMLNRGKGPAVWAPRAQVDSHLYPATLQRYLREAPNLQIITAGVETIDTQRVGTETCVAGVTLTDGRQLRTPAVIVTSGTFLRGLMHTGEQQTTGGRVGEQAAVGLSGSLARLGLEMGRLKTGTPPRLDRATIDFAQLEEQHGDAQPRPFSFLNDSPAQAQISCWITYTNPQAHAIIQQNLHRAPMYSGQIASRGPRYCPSIEDKIVRFADKERHQLFLEPEARDSERIYANGISTSLPQDVQEAVLALIPGLERAKIVQLGYAVEYDFVLPEQLAPTMMVKRVPGLYLAGQICGTSGYEEAAGQGIVAGINAARAVARQGEFVLRRDEAYIGVMIDDLVTRGVTEPYRMFTSRAEHRMALRYDNADTRLTPRGRSVGLVDAVRWVRFEDRAQRIAELTQRLGALRHDGRSLYELLKRPDESGEEFVDAYPELRQYVTDREVWERTRVLVKYEGYLKRQERMIARFREMEDQMIPPEIDYGGVAQLRREAMERLSAVRPRSLGQAARVSGVHPADVSILQLHLAAQSRTGTDRSATGRANPALL
jgi:tRNA uridine 5-carboxymethylaminomethyl modification enzyme